jgi:hypothetical protein
MPIPSEPYIDISAGLVHGRLVEGQSFAWYNSNALDSCTLGGYSNWCTMPSNTIGAGMSQQATVLEVTGSFSYSSPCLNTPSPIIVVHPVTMPEVHRKTA